MLRIVISVRSDTEVTLALTSSPSTDDPRVSGVGDVFFRESFLQANAQVNRALNMTLR